MATASSSEHISIRRATPADAAALRRLARLDSATVPAGEVIVADIGGELRAAVGVADGRAIADPFYETAALVGLLTVRARQIRAAAAPRPTTAWGRLRDRVETWSALSHRAATLHPTV